MALGKSLGSRRQAILLGALGVVLLLALVRWRPGSTSSGPLPPASKGERRLPTEVGEDSGRGDARGKRSGAKEVSPDEVPVLEVEDFGPWAARKSVDGGRDLFDLREPTRPPPPTPTPAPPSPGDQRFVGPLPPPSPTPTPRPPDVSFKFIGTFGPREQPIAVIQQGDQVYNVRVGDVLFGKFVLLKVGYESIDVGFVGFPTAEPRRLGITP